MKNIIYTAILSLILASCAYDSGKSIRDKSPEILTTNIQGTGYALELTFEKGKQHNHPLMAIWIEDTDGKYIQTLYVAQSVAKAYFQHGDKSSGKWQPGPIRRPASLPYWAHKRGIKQADGTYMPTQENPVPDAYTGATPQGNFVLNTKTDDKNQKKFRILMEINQSWDWNNYWHNSKYPTDNNYKTSSQPALVYQAIIDTQNPQTVYEMTLIGHSHWAGNTGELFTDLSTITTAKEITQRLTVSLK